jgi:hypothetical protein
MTWKNLAPYPEHSPKRNGFCASLWHNMPLFMKPAGRGYEGYSLMGMGGGRVGYLAWYNEIRRAITGNSKSADKLGNIIFTGTCTAERLSDARKWQIVLVFLWESVTDVPLWYYLPSPSFLQFSVAEISDNMR